MRVFFTMLILSVFSVVSPEKPPAEILSLKMHLSLLDTEDFNGPEIDAFVDFKINSGLCKICYSDPRKNDSSYYFPDPEIKEILARFQQMDPDTLKPEYNSRITDQATSYMTITTTRNQYHIKDTGLRGNARLERLYRIHI